MNQKDFLSFCYHFALILIAFLIFVFGRHSKAIEAEFSFPYEIKRDEENSLELAELIDFAEIKKEEESNIGITASTLEQGESTDYLFAASKNGKKYYPKGSKSLNRIKQENLIYFQTEEEAIKAGYSK